MRKTKNRRRRKKTKRRERCVFRCGPVKVQRDQKWKKKWWSVMMKKKYKRRWQRKRNGKRRVPKVVSYDSASLNCPCVVSCPFYDYFSAFE